MVDVSMSRRDVVITCYYDVIHREAWHVIYLRMLVTEMPSGRGRNLLSCELSVAMAIASDG